MDVLKAKVRREELLQERRHLDITAEGSVMALAAIFDGFTPLNKLDLKAAAEHMRELEARQVRATEIEAELARLDRVVRGF